MTTRRNLIIGTAGHIDHGKTVLVKALTGRDTDRLAEEKERGISIDLGFAPLKFSDGSVAGIVDVPGHENFVRNMLAGATGVDLALLVIAADDGVMPQTREHLAILDLLGVSRAVVAVTKADLVDDEMIELVIDEVEELLRDTALDGSPIVPVSGITGLGIDELRSELEKQASEVRLKDEELPPRLPIDRVFTLRGIGTVVTGTLWSGTIENNSQLELLPRRIPVRVRGLQVHDSDREVAFAGERVAVNLAGISRDETSRGDTVTAPGYLRPTFMIDARVTLLRDWVRPLRRGMRLRLHHGTREVLGRIYPLETEKIEPGGRAAAQLRLESDLVCAPSDRFVLRSYSPVTTIGGGVIVDAHPRKHRVHDPPAVLQFEELESGDPARAMSVYLKRSGKPVSTAGLVLSSGLAPGTVHAGLERLTDNGLAVSFGDDGALTFLHREQYDASVRDVREALAAFHEAKPLAEGIVKETLRKQMLAGWDARSSDALLDNLEKDGVIETEGKVVRLAGSSASVTGDQENLLADVLARISGSPVSPPTLSELASDVGQDRGTLSELLAVAEKEKKVVRISPELYFSPEAISGIRNKLTEVAGSGGVTVSDFKTAIGTSRKYALPLLEYFDRMRITVRVGDLRKLR